MIAVTTAPARIPRKGFAPREMNIVLNASDSLKGFTASDIVLIPMNRIPKPMMMPATSLLFAFLPTREIITPTITAKGARVEGLRNFAHSAEDTSQPVIVVPILAPMITLIACVRFIRPAFTKPTTITVVAEELWMIAVTNAPSRMPISLFCVRTSRIFFILEPAAFCRPSAMMFMP